MDINDRDHEIHGEDRLRNVDVAYEKQDLGARGILLFFAFLFISGIVVHFAVWGLYSVLRHQASLHDPVPHPLAPVERAPQAGILQNTPGVNVQKFPTPRLQADDVTDMDKFRWQEQQLLTAQPWRDETGAIHIPVERAMELMAQRGMPSRNAPVPTTLQDSMGLPLGTQPPMEQTESGNIGLSEQKRATDATSVPGAPEGDTQNISGREKLKPVPGVNPTEPKNPSRGRGEHQNATPK